MSDPRIVTPIAKPLADSKQTKRVLKLVKKAIKAKGVRRGVKEVVKALRKGTYKKAICVLAADISPMDVITHIPILCEDSDIKYVFVPSKEELGVACSTKRPTSCVLVVCDGEEVSYKKYYTAAEEHIPQVVF
eukprot:TRINITY_DN1674_c0_g1_i1.p1 TRINITY_DN1674_c0_g1~~TRINITY_DN1674_c0_g1_i1.p1  ORF type:complete len:154 (-),score=0.32 TRINITY_DN1674_c0_g1_i1:39-437(-)